MFVHYVYELMLFMQYCITISKTFETVYCLFVCCWLDSPQWARGSSFTRFLDHTQRRTTVGRTALDERLARHRDLYLTTHNTHNRQTSMLPMGFEPTISAGERPQTYALDRAANGTSLRLYTIGIYKSEVPDNRHYRTSSPCWFVHKRVYMTDK